MQDGLNDVVEKVVGIAGKSKSAKQLRKKAPWVYGTIQSSSYLSM